MSSGKQRKPQLTLQHKLQELEKIDEGWENDKIMSTFNIATRTVRKLIKEAPLVFKEADENWSLCSTKNMGPRTALRRTCARMRRVLCSCHSVLLERVITHAVSGRVQYRTVWRTLATLRYARTFPHFCHWSYRVFLLIVRKDSTKRVALVKDNESSHKALKYVRNQVDIVQLPPNVTAVHQPMELCIFFAWKRQHRKRKPRGIETWIERRRLKAANTPRTNGIAHGFDPNMLDVMQLRKDAWDNNSNMTLERC